MDIYIYKDIVTNLLIGNTKLIDTFFKQNPWALKALKVFIQNLIKQEILKYPENQTLYRGILLPKNNGDTLKPLDYIKTLSFTEDIEVAKDFANIDSEMSSFYKSLNPTHTGYIITHTPEIDEVLFHYSWFDKIGLDKIIELDKDLVIEQKETILFQKGLEFEVVPYSKFVCTLDKQYF